MNLWLSALLIASAVGGVSFGFFYFTSLFAIQPQR
jgi:hypothetical protein